METPINIRAMLEPLFRRKPMTPASKESIDLFKSRARERAIPDVVVKQLVEFYSIVNGVPCINSLDIHKCDDLALFEWWDDDEVLWLGQRDFYTLRWSGEKDRFCVGDGGNVCLSNKDQYTTFAQALHAIMPK